MDGEVVHVERYVEWRLTRATEMRFKELVQELDFVEEDSDAYYEIQEQIRGLPNFPMNTSETDYIHRVITDVWH